MNGISLPFLGLVVYLQEGDQENLINQMTVNKDSVCSNRIPPILKQEIYACSFHTNAFQLLCQHVTEKGNRPWCY